MEAAIRRLIQAIHDAPPRCVLALTGGGATAAGLLLSVPGGSRTVLEAVVPYDERALTEFLGRRPEQFCSAETAEAMAARARDRAGWLAPGEPVVGLGCTASLATDRPKKGEHRFHVAVSSEEGTTHLFLILAKGGRDREGEEDLLCRAILNALAEAFGVPETLELLLLPGEQLRRDGPNPASAWTAFLRSELPAVCQETDGRIHSLAAAPPVILPGSFNPLHEGHLHLAEAAQRMTALPAAFEISIVNVDKPPLRAEELRRRLGQFTGRAPVWLTRAPTFAEKAALFPGVVFVVGADTADRLVQPRYYQDSEVRMAEALDGIRARDCRFLVAGRLDREGRFVELDRLSIPAAWRDLFTPIPAAEFRLDLSSTQLRLQGATVALPSAAG